MSLYLDTSCLLKLLLVEPESASVRELVVAEPEVVVSALAQLEAAQALLAMRLGGEISRAQQVRLQRVLGQILETPPFVLLPFPADTIALAGKQAASGVYCRTLDRLHLAVMESAGLRRLLTNDATQAAAAKALGFAVITPG